MSYGYSARIVKLNALHDDSFIGVALGRVCIAQDIPVTRVATTIGVSRQTVYNWFCGLYEPSAAYKDAIIDLTAQLKSPK